MQRIIIDHCIVSKHEKGGIWICTIDIAKKMDPMLDIDTIPKISHGNEFKENKLISKLSDGVLTFEDLVGTNQTIPIFIKRLFGKTYKLELSPYSTVDELKQKIKEKEGVPEPNQKLMFEEKTLEHGKKLSDYNIYKNAIVHFVLLEIK
jgi:hypothetical protein